MNNNTATWAAIVIANVWIVADKPFFGFIWLAFALLILITSR